MPSNGSYSYDSSGNRVYDNVSDALAFNDSVGYGNPLGGALVDAAQIAAYRKQQQQAAAQQMGLSAAPVASANTSAMDWPSMLRAYQQQQAQQQTAPAQQIAQRDVDIHRQIAQSLDPQDIQSVGEDAPFQKPNFSGATIGVAPAGGAYGPINNIPWAQAQRQGRQW
jgi:hypothetical protein